MISTRDRVGDLRRTCAVLEQLAPAPFEILITADGCRDGTVEFVRREMPHSNLIVNENARGSVLSRDRMLRQARGELVFALDDDSYPEQLDCILKFVPLFEQRPHLAVAHFPQRTDEYPDTLAQTDFGPARLTRSFANSGAVLRRSVYLQLSGFERRFFHAYEEPDYAIQCVGAGYEVLFSPVVTIRHHYSPQERSELRTHHRHARNECWSTLMRCPLPQMPFLAAYRVFSQFRYAWKRGMGWVLREPAWWGQALLGVPYCVQHRNALSWRHYRRWLQLSQVGTAERRKERVRGRFQARGDRG